MVIPGVNGSVLASAYQQSKLRRRFNQGGPVKPYANLWAVSPQGDFNYQAGVNKGPFSARVTGSTNVPNLRQNFLDPSLSMNAGPANVGFTPRGVSAGIGGGNAYLQGSADYSGETASVQGGVFGQKFGVNADAFLDRSKYVDAGVTASYNVAPGLSVEGSYRYNNFEGPSQDYFLGARYSKRFKEGGRLQQAYMKSGGKHGGLDRWFAEKWVDVKSGKPCGRQEGEDRAYPACRPSRRVSSQTPKTSSEMSSQEKAKFKSAKTSSERIPYNHKRK